MISRIPHMVLILVCALLLVACQTPATESETPPTVEPISTVEIVVGETPDLEARPLPSPSATSEQVEKTAWTEEELIELIEATVDDTAQASQDAYEALENASEDDALTTEEVEQLLVYWYAVDVLIAETEVLLSSYYDTYGELAAETYLLLEEMEQTLDDLAQSMEDILVVLESSSVLNASSLESLQQAAAQAAAQGHELSEIAEPLLAVFFEERAVLLEELTSLAPDEVVTNRAALVAQLWDYGNLVEQALSDDWLELSELQAIAQAGVNAQAGLEALAGQLNFSLAGFSPTDLTAALVFGDLAQARTSLNQLQGALPARP